MEHTGKAPTSSSHHNPIPPKKTKLEEPTPSKVAKKEIVINEEWIAQLEEKYWALKRK